MNEDQKNEKIGRTIVNITWFIFAAKFIIVATVIAGIILYLIDKPLWIAPITGVALFTVYRLIWRLVWVFIEWAGKQ